MIIPAFCRQSRHWSNKLIARELQISEKTVKAHLTSVFSALGVTDRTQAALWAQRHLPAE
jgi:DNA-binding NarL/FixJ family response regulator